MFEGNTKIALKDLDRRIELRSDTFTHPTTEMLHAMSNAEFGDDVYGEDPTVNKLEQLAATLFGKEEAIFMPSGTMANLASIMAHCPRGSKVLVGNESDIYIYEAAGASVCGGVMYEPLKTQSDGRIDLSDLESAFPNDLDDPQFALPSLICLENPHNRMGGSVLPISYLSELKEFSGSKKIPIHMDGARIFNAAISLNRPVKEIAYYADSLQFCLSKGLSSPVGSIVVGSRIFIKKVRRIRKMLGGGMRQAGVLAAAGIISLTKMTDRLKEDHDNARLLAEGLSNIDGVFCNLASIETNIVFFRIKEDIMSWQSFIRLVRAKGLFVEELGHGRIRAVTHRGVSAKDIHNALDIVKDVLES